MIDRDTVIRLAQQAGMVYSEIAQGISFLEHFANLVAEESAALPQPMTEEKRQILIAWVEDMNRELGNDEGFDIVDFLLAAAPATSAEPCPKCSAFFPRFRCSAATHGECDCPKCQGMCGCGTDGVSGSDSQEKKE